MPIKITHSVNVELTNGQLMTHTAELLELRHEGDGSTTAIASCCGKVGAAITCIACNGVGCANCHGAGSLKDEDTRTSYNFYDIAVMTNEELTAKLQGHVERVANHHAGAHRAKDFMTTFTAPDVPTVTTPGKAG
jgi:DnaJ-class molecular chaperone